MRFFRYSSAAGFRLTATAAALVVAVAVLANPFTGLVRFGSHRAGPFGTLIGALVMAAALLDRWRPMRWLVRVTTFFAALTYGGLALAGFRPTFAYAGVAVLCAVISTILGSRPVRRWFCTPANEWGDAGEEALAAPATMLPPEKVEGGAWAARTRPAPDAPARDGGP